MRPMQNDDGLAGARPACDPSRAVVVPVHEPSLLRVEEDPPGTEVALVDNSLQFLVRLDPCEGQLSGGALERVHQRLVRVGIGVLRYPETELVLDVAEGEPARELQ